MMSCRHTANPLCWNIRFITFLKKLGSVEKEADPCSFAKRSRQERLSAIYVDDGLLAASDESTLKACLEGRKLQYKITSKDASYFLGLEIRMEQDSISFSQTAVLEDYSDSDHGNWLQTGRSTSGVEVRFSVEAVS